MVFAFSNLMRALFLSTLHRFMIWFVTRFWIYRIWVKLRQKWASESQWRQTEAYISKQKAEEGNAARRRFAMKVEEARRLQAMRKKDRDDWRNGRSQSEVPKEDAQPRRRWKKSKEAESGTVVDLSGSGSGSRRWDRLGVLMGYRGKWREGISLPKPQEGDGAV